LPHAPSGSRRQYGASSLSTIMQMVANGFGTTLMPTMALPVELRPDMPVSLFRFATTRAQPLDRAGLAQEFAAQAGFSGARPHPGRGRGETLASERAQMTDEPADRAAGGCLSRPRALALRWAMAAATPPLPWGTLKACKAISTALSAAQHHRRVDMAHMGDAEGFSGEIADAEPSVTPQTVRA
jgi:hypothetical protein